MLKWGVGHLHSSSKGEGMARIIQAQYDVLDQVARDFMRQAEQIQSLRQQVYHGVNQLGGSGWTGLGANSFFAEMREQVLPGVDRLVNALCRANAMTLFIIKEFHEAEDAAARVFDEVGGAVVSHQGGGKKALFSPASQMDGKGGTGNSQGLDTLSGDSAHKATSDFAKYIDDFGKYFEGMTNLRIKALSVKYALERLFTLNPGGAFQSIVSNATNLIISTILAVKDTPGAAGGLVPLATAALKSAVFWFSAYSGAQAVENYLEAFQNILTTGSSVDLNDGYNTLVELAYEQAVKDGIAQSAAAYDADLRSMASLAGMSGAIDNAVAANPNAKISGQVYTQDGKTYATITADGKEIFRGQVQPEAGAFIENTFEKYGPNFTTPPALQQGVLNYLSQKYPTSAGYFPADYYAASVMKTPGMQDIKARIDAGEVVTPAELQAAIDKNPVAVPQVHPTPSPVKPTVTPTPAAP
jgi:WXG100 family type VII secretion target